MDIPYEPMAATFMPPPLTWPSFLLHLCPSRFRYSQQKLEFLQIVRGVETVPAVSPGKSSRLSASQHGGGIRASQKHETSYCALRPIKMPSRKATATISFYVRHFQYVKKEVSWRPYSYCKISAVHTLSFEKVIDYNTTVFFIDLIYFPWMDIPAQTLFSASPW